MTRKEESPRFIHSPKDMSNTFCYMPSISLGTGDKVVNKTRCYIDWTRIQAKKPDNTMSRPYLITKEREVFIVINPCSYNIMSKEGRIGNQRPTGDRSHMALRTR